MTAAAGNHAPATLAALTPPALHHAALRLPTARVDARLERRLRRIELLLDGEQRLEDGRVDVDGFGAVLGLPLLFRLPPKWLPRQPRQQASARARAAFLLLVVRGLYELLHEAPLWKLCPRQRVERAAHRPRVHVAHRLALAGVRVPQVALAAAAAACAAADTAAAVAVADATAADAAAADIGGGAGYPCGRNQPFNVDMTC
eukprot:360019-Chlamydomonas_euryale.AAC.8